jgi:hypothetical protein
MGLIWVLIWDVSMNIRKDMQGWTSSWGNIYYEVLDRCPSHHFFFLRNVLVKNLFTHDMFWNEL